MPERRPVRARLGRALPVLALLAVAIVWMPGLAGRAEAHPLGNFTVNRWARIEPTIGLVRITYVLDLAEIPTYQDRLAIAADRAVYARERVAEIARALDLRVDGSNRLPLAVRDLRVDQPDGDGGLPTTRIAVLFEATLPADSTRPAHDLVMSDMSDPDRLGWREVTAAAPVGTTITAATVPATDISDQLRRYPPGRLSSPLDVRRATVTYTVGDKAAGAPALQGPGTGRSTDRLGRLLATADPSVLAVAGLLGVAFLIGCGHALAPGHGKTVMAAYLVGTRGRPVDAVLLGAIVAAMHTSSVLLLGVVLHQLDNAVAVERIYPALTLASGAIVVGFGGWLLAARVRRLRATKVDHHHHEDHADHADHSGHEDDADHAGQSGHEDHQHGDSHHHHHDHGPGGHTHELDEGVAPLSPRGLVVLASSGGIVPSPSAVVVLVSSLAVGRLALGLSLIVAFSVGLAATLSGVGLALVYGRRMADARLSARAIRLFPVLGAAAILVLGLLLLVRGVQSL